MNIGDITRRNAAYRPRDPAYTTGDWTVTWADLDDRVNRIANAFLAQGLQRGDRVAMLGRNDHRYFEAQFACAKAGLVSVPVNHRFAPPEVAYVLDNAGASLCVVDASGQALVEGTGVTTIGYGPDHGASLDYEELVAASSTQEPDVRVAGRDVAVLGYTSGTTGRPKGAMLTHHSTMISAYAYAALVGLGRDEVFLACMPAYVYRAGSAPMATPLLGGHSVVLDFKVPAVLDAIERHRVTWAVVAPAMISMLLDDPTISERDLSSIRGLFSGSAPIRPEKIRRMTELLPNGRMGSMYGMTEATSIATMFHDPDDPAFERRLLAAGRPTPLLDIEIVDPETGERRPTGEVGELRVRGETVMVGYWGDPERSAAALHDGWFSTGDLGYLDDEGYLYLVDRRIDIINSGGLNVYSLEVENALALHPAVADCAVVGIPHERWGETPMAFIVVEPGASVTEQELLDWCRSRLASYKKPGAFAFVDALPRSSVGKIDKKVLRAPYWQRDAASAPA